MSRLEKAFGQGKALIPFITCGDPSLDVSAAVVRALEKAGADALLLGIPFSDPTAEGPVVQSANVRALAAGCKKQAAAIAALLDAFLHKGPQA